MGPPTADRVLVERLGNDQVFASGDRLIIESSTSMVDWEARTYRLNQVVYKGRSFAIDAVERASGRRTTYVLVPWPDRPHEPLGRTFVYNAAFVRKRDLDRRRYRIAEGVNLVLTPFEPLVGFLPSRWLEVLGGRYGIHIERAHGLSIYLEYLAALLAVASLYLGLFPAARGRMFLVILLLFVDSGMRYHHRLAETPTLYSPLEWLFHRR